ncbi:MAG: class I SAM-dependent methyltransferase [Bacteroidales bacterium]|nr:class I SAM-dependent methyltransferase [Bacteroidales bacterium]
MVEFPDKQWKDYELLDSGCGEKLERFGSVVMARPEPKALWDKSLTEAEWKRLSQVAFKLAGSAAKSGAIEDRGTWERRKKIDDQWYISYPGLQDGLKFRLRLGLTAFKHVGVFPEQAPNWEFIYSQVRRLAGADNTPKVLNLFAYTGGASLAAKAAGADVTHLDSIKQVVTWARGNMEASGMDGIRWIVEDAMKFVQREERRGNLYDGIILDPPAYGHGPNGEKWKLDESLFGLLKGVAHILKPKDSFMVLNLYSNGYSAALGETLVREAFGLPVAEGLSSGELALPDPFGKTLPLSIYVRLVR